MDCIAGVQFSPGSRDLSLLHSIQTCCGAHPASYIMGTGLLPPGVKRPGREADHSHPSSTEVENGGGMSPLPHTSSWRGASLIKHRDFTFTLPRLTLGPN
jgi:hypothetical protein